MSLNSNAHFSKLPAADIRRSILDRSTEHVTTGNVGDLIVLYYDEILPGDTVSIDTSKVIRFQTMLSPVMGNAVMDFYWFFVPNRLVWDHWVNLMGENTASAWAPSVQYTVPTIKVPPKGSGSNNYAGSILDYLGFPVEMAISAGSYEEVNALPVRGYAKIVDDWFRSEDLTDPINLYTGDASVTANTAATYVDDVPLGGAPFKVAKFRDFWTTMQPSPQKGDPVLLPIQAQAPVFARTDRTLTAGDTVPTGVTSMKFTGIGGGTVIDPVGVKYIEMSDTDLVHTGASGAAADAYLSPANLWADLSTATAVSVNDLRFAFQLQKLLERDTYGTRYKETIKAHFNVDVPDSRLQRSEYLGGNRVPINVSQVTNTAQSSSDPLGDIGAMSVTGDYHSDFTKSFTEHGMLFCVACCRTEKIYSQGLEPFWHRSDRYSYYWPVFANIGYQPYRKDGLYLGAQGTFGFNEAWADYRYKPSRVSGYMRPYLQTGLGSWTYADDYASAPSLSDGWIREDPANVDRTLAVTGATAGFQYWIDIYFKVRHTRPMPVYSIPGLIDHH